jgi:hypothetical protein
MLNIPTNITINDLLPGIGDGKLKSINDPSIYNQAAAYATTLRRDYCASKRENFMTINR